VFRTEFPFVSPSHLLFGDRPELRLDIASFVHLRSYPFFDSGDFCRRYFAPELAGGGKITCLSDVYSVGVVWMT
jgi:hypothetical protein